MSTYEPGNPSPDDSGATPPYGQAPVPPAASEQGPYANDGSPASPWPGAEHWRPADSAAQQPTEASSDPTAPYSPPHAGQYGHQAAGADGRPAGVPYNQQPSGGYGQPGTGPYGQPGTYGHYGSGAGYTQPGSAPAYGHQGYYTQQDEPSQGSTTGPTWPGYGQGPQAQSGWLAQGTARPAAKSHRVRNSLVVAAVLLGTAAGGVAVGRASTVQTSNAAATSPTGGSSSSSGTGSTGSGSSGSGTLPAGSSSGSSGSGASTGVGAGGGSLNVSSIAAKVDPAVVDIDTVLGYQEESAAGTGIVVTSTGEVVTNNHVVDGATSIRVTDIGNGHTYAAKVVGTDATDDIAVIQLENASGLATVSLGNSSTLTSGEAVLAIGNAGGAGGTPSTAAGSVVALNQSITAADDSGADSEHLTGLVETDAPIEPGDSGGPLVNSSAQVVAIDTAASSGNQFQSASTQAYAIPIDKALAIAQQIENGQGSAAVHIGETGILGVEVEEAGGMFSGSSETGAAIAAVIPGSPAASAGLEEGDVIVSLNGQAVSSPSDLSSLMSSRHPGDRVTVGYDDASGQLQTVTLTLAAGPPA